MKDKKRWKQLLTCILVFLVFISMTAFSLSGQTCAQPENPIRQIQEDSQVINASSLATYLPQSEQIQKELEQQKSEADSNEVSRQEKKDDSSSNRSDSQKGGQKGSDANGGSGGSDGKNGTDPGKIQDGDGDAQNFFTTSIVDGETVTQEAYSFTITQLQHDIPLTETLVFVNEKKMTQFNGKVPLQDGANKIKVTCSYQKRGEKAFSVSRSYTVYLDTTNIVFFTNLEDEGTVDTPYFSFIAYAQYKGDQVPLEVSVNGEGCSESTKEENTYHALLKKKENTITLKATTSDGKTETKTYKIRMSLDDAYILTDLDRVSQQEASSEKLTFYASVMDKDSEQEHPIQVTFNGQALKKQEDFNYQVKLKEGANTFVLDGSEYKTNLQQTYVVYYYAPASGLEIRTDLDAEQTVNDASFTFFAYARDDRKNVKLKVTVNGKEIDGNSNHYYSVGLKKNDNSIVLTADNGTEKKVQEYVVTYEPKKDADAQEPDDTNEPKEDPYAPSLSSPDLYDGMQVTGAIKNFTVKAVDYEGNRLNASHLTLKLNGYSSGISLVWDDSVKTSYRLKLKTGENILTIKVVDDEGHKKTFLIHIISKAVDPGASIGTARFSIDGEVLGLSYLVAPTDVEIYDGENAAYLLDRFLKNNGFTYNYTGSLQSGFYLARINKRGLLKNLSDEMRTKYAGKFDENSLGEFDFNNRSGWMYSVNGDFPNYGFADAYLQDGDEVRIKFTLDYGDDIGGGMAMGK